MLLLELFLTFLKIGSFSFGGGYAMISLLQYEALSNNWMTTKEFADIVAISQITPGPVAVNMATFVGFRQAGTIGALVCTMGVSVPSLVFVLIVLQFISKFNNSKYVKNIFEGLRPAVAGMIFVAAIQIAWAEFFPNTNVLDFTAIASSVEFKAVLISLAVFIGIYKFKIGTIKMIAASAIVGAFVFK